MTPSTLLSTALVRDVAALRDAVARLRRDGPIAFVPTMGALHDGHLSLIDLGRAHAAHVVVSIFVNPTQFGPNEDLSRYPRDEAGDVAKVSTAGASLVFAPGVEVMYPQGHQTIVRVPRIAEPLDGVFRPGHFDGVATVVTKLFGQVRPDVAIFGEKDYQQLLVIRQLTADLDLGVEIIGAPIRRDADGLALSSRNQYLSPTERAQAATLPATMAEVTRALAGGASLPDTLDAGRARLMAAGFGPIDYFEVRTVPDLALALAAPSDPRTARLFAAAFLGRTRLIDNIPLG